MLIFADALPRRKPTVPQTPPQTAPTSIGGIFGTTPEPIPRSTAPAETVDVLLTDFLVRKWLDFRRDNLRLIGVSPQKQSLTGTSPRTAHIPLWTVSCAGSKNTKGTTTMKSSDLWLQPNQQTTSPGYAYASERPEPRRGSQTKPAPSYRFDMGGTWTSSSGSSSNTYAPRKDNKPSMRYVVANSQTTKENERSKPSSEPWMTSGSDAALNSQRSPQESSSYDDQRQTLSTSVSSTLNSTYTSPMDLTPNTDTKMPPNPSGRRKLPTTHTSSHSSKSRGTTPLPSTTELVAWEQLPRDGGGVTIGTNFHFPPSY